ncbi:hypothetical protein PVAP13_4KG279900 [Panicum virgatum]|uniref:NAC domain-containing protein n=1 Tax=Panicum virgatum TaxID=38727 RepID=A0A8T0TKF0_PANVG|nr:hypothetical protein PVAP13_4KG279900 [Panicum virgatum]
MPSPPSPARRRPAATGHPSPCRDYPKERWSSGASSSSGGAAELELTGFRFGFHPTEEELLEFYLKQVAHGKKLKFDIIPTVQLYRHDPGVADLHYKFFLENGFLLDCNHSLTNGLLHYELKYLEWVGVWWWQFEVEWLPALAHLGEREWYFFVPRDGRKQQAAGGGGGRPNRTTERGFWKATGSDRAVRCASDPKRLIGLKKTLVDYEGRAPRGTKTDWVMNDESRRRRCRLCSDMMAREDIVLCKIYRKAVSLKELEQRVAMKELARASATPSSASHNTGSPTDSTSMSSSDHQQHQQQQGEAAVMTTMMMGVGIPPARRSICMKKEAAESAAAAVLRPATLSLPQLEVAKQQQQEWMQDPFLTQLRSPWMDSPYYASVLNF